MHYNYSTYIFHIQTLLVVCSCIIYMTFLMLYKLKSNSPNMDSLIFLALSIVIFGLVEKFSRKYTSTTILTSIFLACRSLGHIIEALSQYEAFRELHINTGDIQHLLVISYVVKCFSAPVAPQETNNRPNFERLQQHSTSGCSEKWSQYQNVLRLFRMVNIAHFCKINPVYVFL